LGIQPATAQAFDSLQELNLVSRNGNLCDVDVMAKVEPRIVHPQRPTQAKRGSDEHLAEPRQEVEPAQHSFASSLQPKPAVALQKTSPVDDGKGPHILRPPLVRPEHESVFGADSLHSYSPVFGMSDVTHSFSIEAQSFSIRRSRFPSGAVVFHQAQSSSNKG
jgi:hypothetical protein